MASEIQQSSDLWDLKHYLTERRKQMDRKARHSQLTLVLGRLYENRLSEEGLRGLREDKMIVNPFSRQIPAGERSLTCMLSAIGCLQHLAIRFPRSCIAGNIPRAGTARNLFENESKAFGHNVAFAQRTSYVVLRCCLASHSGPT